MSEQTSTIRAEDAQTGASSLERRRLAREAVLATIQSRLELKEAVLFVLRGTNVRKFNNVRSSFKQGGKQKPHAIYMRVAVTDPTKQHIEPEEWILQWQDQQGVVLSVSDGLFDAGFQGSRWVRPGPKHRPNPINPEPICPN